MNESMINEIRPLLEQREMAYRFLSQIYGLEVTAQLLANLYDELSGNDELDGGYALLSRYLESVSGQAWDKAAEELATEHAGLFLSGYGKSVSLYESVYVSSKGLIMQEPRDQVLALYREEGLESTASMNTPEDHLAIELDFMGYMVERARQALESHDHQLAIDYLNKADRFLHQHLLNWVPRFCQQLEQIARSDFYKGIVQLTLDLLDFDQEASGEMMEILKAGSATPA